jgi:hypothetical protein
LNVPPTRFASYVVPVAAFLVGALLLFQGFRTWMKPVATESASSRKEAKSVAQDEYIRKFEEESKKRKQG